LFSPPYHGETQESVVGAIKLLRPMLIGQDPFDVERLEADMDNIIQGNAFAKATLDFALHDIMGKKLGKPIYALLGGKCREEVEMTQVLGWGEPAANAKQAHRYVEEGFSTIKMKVGMKPIEMDLARVKAVRDDIGPSINIRVDANQCWRHTEAIKVLRKMQKYDLQYVEQPVPYWDLEGMARVRKAIEIPVEADESLFSYHDAIKLIEMKAADIFNIKLVKGGFRAAKKIAAVAESAGLSCVVGAMVELGVGTAAGIHFAASTRNIGYACECCGAIFYEDIDIVKDQIVPMKGRVRVPEKPGLGVELDEKKLESMRVSLDAGYQIEFGKHR
jgi:L-alanine-DL-glutamate epimerase-like enolase superfamily enzyme